jgi:hypothetical protein
MKKIQQCALEATLALDTIKIMCTVQDVVMRLFRMETTFVIL